jgi:GntR family L-lactate dehydrogenase operon transcriptional regulator
MTENLEYLLLEHLDRSDAGIGSGNLHLALRDRRIQASQATVGRMLRLLDHRRLTEKVSNKGRVLTPSGRRHLESLRQREGLRFWAEGVLKEVTAVSQTDYLQALDALRFLEGQITRFAAERATAEQIAAMERTLSEHQRRLATTTRGKNQGLQFHELVAQAAGNRFLVSASEMIWSWNRAIRDLWREADVLTGKSSLPDHRRILRAIAERDGGAAERAMRAHFGVFIESVKEHFAEAVAAAAGDGHG